MCSLCGILGGNDHWTDAVPREGVFTRNVGPAERRRERANRVRTANVVLAVWRLTLEDWQGTCYILRTATGRSEVIDSLAHLWPMAEQLAGRPCDPLAPEVLARLESR